MDTNQMKHRGFAKIRLAALVAVAVLVLVGLVCRDDSCGVVAALIYLPFEVVEFVRLYRMAKLFNEGKLEEQTSLAERIGDRLRGAIFISCLFWGILFPTNLGSAIAAYTIWCGTILLGFLSGLVGGMVTGIPLRFGYGGWEIKRRRRR
jgi:hypothetical protein